MAILDYEHFARETNLALPAWLSAHTGGSVTADGTGPFNYGRAYTQTAGFFTGRMNAFPAVTQLWVNLHSFQTGHGTGQLLQLRNGSGSQCGARFNAGGQIEILRTDLTVVATVPNYVMALNTWNFFQFRFLVSPTVGECEVWVNGRQFLNATGLNLRGAANDNVDGWRIQTNTVTNSRISNVILYSLVGDAPTARTPETRIWVDLPNAPGASSAWTRSSGAANWEMVDEQPSDGDTTFNSAASLIDDLYSCPASVPAGAIVYTVAVEHNVRKDDAGVNEVVPLLRSNAVTAASPSPLALTTEYQRQRHIWHTDPDGGGAWTVARANGAQPGVRRTV